MTYLNCHIISFYRVTFYSCDQEDEPVKPIQDFVADSRNFPPVSRVTIINANQFYESYIFDIFYNCECEREREREDTFVIDAVSDLS